MTRQATNKLLHKAKKSKSDEFYTQLCDIESELQHYKEHFKNKVIYCNCDDPRESNFFRYFAKNFEDLGIKKLISSCYVENGEGGFLLEYTNNDKEEKTYTPQK